MQFESEKQDPWQDLSRFDSIHSNKRKGWGNPLRRVSQRELIKTPLTAKGFTQLLDCKAIVMDQHIFVIQVIVQLESNLWWDANENCKSVTCFSRKLLFIGKESFELSFSEGKLELSSVEKSRSQIVRLETKESQKVYGRLQIKGTV
jgi:hypothetical protein